MDVNCKYQDKLCASCQKYLLTYRFTITIEGQTFESFKDAVDNKCFICSLVWHRGSWARSIPPESWSPLLHYVSGYGPRDPRNELQVSNVQFKFIPADVIGTYIDFPVLDTTINKQSVATSALPWLEECRLTHPRCDNGHSSAQRWRPTRLLDIGAEGDTRWKLCVTSEDTESSAPISYVTLSYRWDPNPRIRLLSSNLERLRQGLPVADLPLLFQDVVVVARQFSVQYVWIDALCIIQDSKDDWERESPMMRHVYSNSLCTMAACSSGSPDDRLFHGRDLDFIRPGKVRTCVFSGPDQPQDYYVYDKSYIRRQIAMGGLNARGWVFQEWYLSPRILYFGRHQLIWQCRTRTRCEVFPEGLPGEQPALPGEEPARVSVLDMIRHPHPARLMKGQMPVEIADQWVDLVSSFSERHLTFSSDKLNAMAGIAKLFEEVSGDEYVAGIWKSRFVEMLDWRVHILEREFLPDDYRAPSWSWASVDSPVMMHELSYRPRRDIKFQRAEADYKDVFPELVRVDVVNQTPDRMSTVISAKAVLRARILPIVCIGVDRVLYTFRSPNGRLKSSAFPDDLGRRFKEGEQVICMPLIQYYHTPDWHMACLMLEEETDSPTWPRAYKRIGSLWIDECPGVETLGGEIREIELI